MSQGIPGRVTKEFERRGELVAVTVRLERGALEDLDVLCRHHYGHANRSEAVRLAVRLLLAREVTQVVRGHHVEQRRAERAAQEARALAFTREIRDRQDMEADIVEALAIVNESLQPGADAARGTSRPVARRGDGSASGSSARLVSNG